MKSTALEKVALIADDGDICCCEEEFYKVCVARISGNLLCKKSIIRVTEIDTPAIAEDAAFDLVKSLDNKLSGINRAMFETLRHLDRIK